MSHKTVCHCLQTHAPENLKVTTDPLEAVMEAGRYWKTPPEVEASPPTCTCTISNVKVLLFEQVNSDVLRCFGQRLQRPERIQKLSKRDAWWVCEAILSIRRCWKGCPRVFLGYLNYFCAHPDDEIHVADWMRHLCGWREDSHEHFYKGYQVKQEENKSEFRLNFW